MNVALLLTAGLLLLLVGGELLVRGAVRGARRLGISPLMIGLTLVGFGTSTPELVTSVHAAAIGQPGIAVGNIVGSNVANLLLVIGASALILPIRVPRGALARDGVLVLVTAVMFAAVSWFYVLDRAVGAVFVAVLVGYLVYAYRQERSGSADHTAAVERSEAHELTVPDSAPQRTLSKGWDLSGSLVLACAGLVLVVLGGDFFVDGAVQLARGMGVSETTIGLTVVAVGTSLPELVTSVVAAYRKHSDLALGNVLGSNIYNTLMIGGLTGVLAPVQVPEAITRFDNPIMIGASALVLVFAYTGLRIGRLEGVVLLACYAAYVLTTWF